MIKNSLFALILVFPLLIHAQPASWKIVPGRITTTWADKVTPTSALPEYPRPQMVREPWINLNGLWSYAIVSGNSKPSNFDGQILVPFAVESALSGVGKRVGAGNTLWYKRALKIPSNMSKGRLLLHFGAVDWKCEVFINGTSAGVHEGGYDPFYFDVTNLIRGRGDQEILVSVTDPSDEGPQPRGKQVKEPKSIWYTPVTGIWQTVWLEAVPSTFIASIKNTPDLDKKQLRVVAEVANAQQGDVIKATAMRANQKIAEANFSENVATITLNDVQEWLPDSPALYDLVVTVTRRGKKVDEVKSYFAMRKISMQKDASGTPRMMLNNKFVFQYGPLDQGWWPDGLYTAPSDEALKFDIVKTKEMGFNMIRKHVKVEPARWYYHCDREGILVWQDMPSGDMGNHWDSRPGILGIATDKERTKESEDIYRREWKAIMNATYNFPSIVVWVPFNEAWGQFKTEEIVKMTAEIDQSRLINAASGGNFTEAGHIIDLHNYPSPAMPDPELFGKDQIVVLGEFGGLGLPLEGHTWQAKDNWGYQSFSTQEDLLAKYESFMTTMTALIQKGLSAAVYTQTTDVEVETNGLMTYDRKVIKMPADKLKQLHLSLYKVSVQ